MATIPIARTIDKRKGAVASGVVMLLILIYLLLTTFEMADPAPKDPIMTTDTVIPEELVLKNKNISKVFFLYDELSSNKGLSESVANEFINDNDVWLSKFGKILK